MHLLLDGTAARPPDNDLMQGCINRVVDFIDLKIIYGPVFFTLKAYRETWVIVAESHICIKAFDDGAVFVDVFSCRAFDVAVVCEMIATGLHLATYTWKEIPRAGTGGKWMGSTKDYTFWSLVRGALARATSTICNAWAWAKSPWLNQGR